MSDDSTGLRPWKFLALLGAAAVTVVFWRDARDRFAEFSGHTREEARVGAIGSDELFSAQGWSLGEVDAKAAAPGYAVRDLLLDDGGVRFRLEGPSRARVGNGGDRSPSGPALAVSLSSVSGNVLRTLLFVPSTYARVTGTTDGWMRLPLSVRAGEVQVTVRPVLATLRPIQ